MSALICFQHAVVILVAFGGHYCDAATQRSNHNHIHHHHHKTHHHKHQNGTAMQHAKPQQNASVVRPVRMAAQNSESTIVSKMKQIEGQLAKEETAKVGMTQRGKLQVNGPLPTDFSERFSQAAAKAVNCNPAEISIVESSSVNSQGTLVEIIFEAPTDVVHAIEDQSADPYSKLTNSPMHSFLVAGGGIANSYGASPEAAIEQAAQSAPSTAVAPPAGEEEEASTLGSPVASNGIDVDTQMPYGELEPFGREDTAQELTESSIKESDSMVDQLERAEVAEEKRAVFRALTRLRGAAITSFDGVARSQTGNIDEYNKVHKWRSTHPLSHLADEESDVSKWAFPDQAD